MKGNIPLFPSLLVHRVRPLTRWPARLTVPTRNLSGMRPSKPVSAPSCPPPLFSHGKPRIKTTIQYLSFLSLFMLQSVGLFRVLRHDSNERLRPSHRGGEGVPHGLLARGTHANWNPGNVSSSALQVGGFIIIREDNIRKL